MNSPPFTSEAVPAKPDIPARLRRTARRLQAAGIEDPDITAGVLLEAACGIPRLRLPLERGRQLNPEQEKALSETAGRILSGEPLQYVLGYTEFYGRRFDCDPRALIPRPETESLVEYVLEHSAARALDAPRIADVGTGTGGIAVTLAREWPHARITAFDISRDALALAKENAARHGVDQRIRWVESDLFGRAEDAIFDLIAANPPYVPTREYRELPGHIREHEPRTALDGGPDGLRVAERLIADAPPRLANNGELILEIGEDQADAVEALMKRHGFRGVKMLNDLAMRPRFMIGTKHGAI